ncbi:hypothetical protein CK222_12760 [Mesorhizobium sp. WSM3866]|nr:hypothetical protein CK222_12760 [Mesorhizobium sp. WSM3866]
MLRHALAKSGVPFSPHNPAHTHHYAKSTRRRAKTDRLDAAQTSQPLRVQELAIIAVARKLLVVLNAIIRDKTAFA